MVFAPWPWKKGGMRQEERGCPNVIKLCWASDTSFWKINKYLLELKDNEDTIAFKWPKMVPERKFRQQTGMGNVSPCCQIITVWSSL